MDATDAQVRKYAEMANASQFIESNYEDLTESEKVAEMRGNLGKVCEKKLSEGKINTDVFFKSDNLTILKLMKEVLEFADRKFLTWLENNIDFFS